MLKYEIVDLPKIAIIGREGFCTKEENVVRELWEQANLRFGDVAEIGMKNADGSYVGFWGAMSDETMSFLPWTDGFTRGFYLAGVEVYEDTRSRPAGSSGSCRQGNILLLRSSRTAMKKRSKTLSAA